MFKELSEKLDSVDIKLSMKKKGDKITVMVEYFNQKAGINFPPVSCTGTAEELDREFLSAINVPIQSAIGIITNAQQVTAAVDKIGEEQKKKKPVTGKITSAAKPEPPKDDGDDDDGKSDGESTDGDGDDGPDNSGSPAPEPPKSAESVAQPNPENVEVTGKGKIRPKKDAVKPSVPKSGPGSPSYEEAKARLMEDNGYKDNALDLTHKADSKGESRPQDLLKKPDDQGPAPIRLDPEPAGTEPPYSADQPAAVVSVPEPPKQQVTGSNDDDW